MSPTHDLERVALKEKHSLKKNAMKKEHDEHMEQQKKTIEDMEKEHVTQWGKLLLDLLTQKSDPDKARHKQKESAEMETHRTAMETEQKHQKVLNDRLKELREHNDKFVKKLKNEHEQVIQDKEA